MGLEIRKTSKWWYARFTEDGKRRVFRLKVKVAGVRPPSLREQGDAKFEESRKAAKAEAERMCDDARAKGADEDYHRRMAALKRRSRTPVDPVPDIPLANLWKLWTEQPHQTTRCEMYVARVRAACDAFAAHAATRGVKLLADVTEPLAMDYLDVLRRKGFAPGTVNGHLVSLRSVCKQLGRLGGPAENPFADIALEKDSPEHRRPLSDEEIERIVAACDPVIRGPVVTAVYTALRRSDACTLRWDAVEMPTKASSGWVVVKTRKTGASVEVPLFPELHTELAKALRSRKGSEYVWPEAARMYRENPCGISYRLRQAIKKAGIERSVERKRGIQKNATKVDFHAFRTTFITKALSAGIPMEHVRRVTGHTTLNTVLKHYFKPERKEMEKAFRPMMKKPRVRKAGRPKKGKGEGQRADPKP